MSFANRVPPISCQSVSWLSVIADLADEEANLDDDDDDRDKEEEEEEGEEEDVFVDVLRTVLLEGAEESFS